MFVFLAQDPAPAPDAASWVLPLCLFGGLVVLGLGCWWWQRRQDRAALPKRDDLGRYS